MWKQRQSDHCALQLSHCEFNILPTDAGHWRRGESRGNGHCRRGAGHAGTISDAGHWRRGAVIGTKLAGLWQLGERNRSGCSSRTFSIATEEKSVRSGASGSRRMSHSPRGRVSTAPSFPSPTPAASQAKGEGGRVEKVTTAAGVRAGQGKNQEQGDDDMMMTAVGVRSGATQWSSAV